MPILGYGVFQVSPEECERCVTDALEVGYRMIDTAQVYQNEEGVGNAVKKSGIPREEIFLVSKIWMTSYGYIAAKEAINESLRKLQTDYLDLMLLHQPFCDYYGAWQALEEAYREGKLRAIGVSNFYPDRLIDLCANVEIRPMVNQVETHVFQQQTVARRYMQELGVAPMAWGPLAEGKNGFFQNETLIKIGEKYGKTGRPPLSDGTGRHRHPQVEQERAHGAEYGHLRLRTLCRRQGRNSLPRRGQASHHRSPRRPRDCEVVHDVVTPKITLS